MSEIHELTEKILSHLGTFNFKHAANMEVKNWLKAAAEKINTPVGICNCNVCRPITVKKILGLEPEVKNYSTEDTSAKIEDKVKEEVGWCSHMIYKGQQRWTQKYSGAEISVGICDNFCSICAAPRPVVKTLEQKFMDTFKSIDNQGEWLKRCEELAAIATAHFGKD